MYLAIKSSTEHIIIVIHLSHSLTSISMYIFYPLYNHPDNVCRTTLDLPLLDVFIAQFASFTGKKMFNF